MTDREFDPIEPTATSDGSAVIVFHGHGSSPAGAQKSFPLAALWPEATIVYPQGLNTPSRTDPEGKRTGWQKALGDQGDRDLIFFDELVAMLREKGIEKIFATGHSNGGSFCYLLWALRSSVLSGIGPSGTSGTRLKQHPDREAVPVFHMAGKKDFIVPFPSQEKAIAAVRAFNGCDEVGESWAEKQTLYRGENPVVFAVSEKGHDVPKAYLADMVRFFRDFGRSPKDPGL